jgi:hypothetical protein
MVKTALVVPPVPLQGIKRVAAANLRCDCGCYIWCWVFWNKVRAEAAVCEVAWQDHLLCVEQKSKSQALGQSPFWVQVPPFIAPKVPPVRHMEAGFMGRFKDIEQK